MFGPLSIIFELGSIDTSLLFTASQQDLPLTQSRITHKDLPAAKKTQKAFHITIIAIIKPEKNVRQLITRDCKFFSRHIALVLWLFLSSSTVSQ